MAQLATFTARVSKEKTHMETLYKQCMAASSTIFHDEKNTATVEKKTEVDKAKTIQTAADAQLVTDLASLVTKNDGLVATKATEMEAPLATKTAAEAEANTALASLDTAKDAVTIDIPLAKKVQNAIVLAAENVKNGNIERRHSGLDGTKQAANATFEEEEKFLAEYCGSTKADLKKELVLVNQIFCKLGGLKVTDTAATGLEAEEKEAQAAPGAVLVCKTAEEKAAPVEAGTPPTFNWDAPCIQTEYTITIDPTMFKAAAQGATVKQTGSTGVVKGTLKTALSGSQTEVVVVTACGVVFDDAAAVTIDDSGTPVVVPQAAIHSIGDNAECVGGSGTFSVNLTTANQQIDVGTIPAGKWNVRVNLSAITDVDVQIFDTDDISKFSEGKAVVAWCFDPSKCNIGELGSKTTADSTTYKDMKVTYSGYHGTNVNHAGDEYVWIDGKSTVALSMKAFAYQTGVAKIDYTWDGKQTKQCLGT